MKRVIKSILGVAGLMAASTVALAQTVPQPQPVPSVAPSPGTGNGGLILSIWDSVTGESIVQYLGLNLNDVLPTTNMTSNDGLVLDFGVVSQFSSIFGDNVPANISYHVTAAESVSSGGRHLATTALPGTNVGGNAPSINTAIGNERDFLELFVNPTTACGGTNPCVATSASQEWFAGKEAFGANLGALTFSAAGGLGSALNFFYITSAGTSPTSAVTVQAYQNAAGFGQWLLGTNGQLTYSILGGTPVPLPGAVWLLLSALTGFGVVTRRNRPAAEAAA
jgi:hypothetical protein